MSIKAKIAAELAERVKGGDGIAMDFASRMQRAKEQGFDTDTVYYHGTNERGLTRDAGDGVIDGFDGTTFLAENPQLAKTYSGAEQGSIYPVYIRNGDQLYVDAKGKDWGSLDGGYLSTDDIAADAFYDGRDSVRFDNVNDVGGDVIAYVDQAGMTKPSQFRLAEQKIRDELSSETVLAIKDPSNIRSVNAAFDPANKGKSNLLGRATPRDMLVGTGAGLTSVALADVYKDYMAKDKALADESLFNFGRMVEQAPENFLNSVQDVASLSGLGDLVRGFALPVATTVGGIDEFNQVNDFVSEFEQPQTRAVNYGMNAITDAILPIYEELSPYISEDYNAIGSSEWPDDYRNPKYRGALNLAHDISRGTYSALTGTTRYLEDKLKE